MEKTAYSDTGKRRRRGARTRRRTGGRRRIAALGCALALALFGCGGESRPETVRETALAVERSGALTYYLVGDFHKSYYDLEELRAMAEEEVQSFGAGVALEKVELLEDLPDKVAVVYRFDGGESFSGFTGRRFFYGTVEEAVSGGHIRAEELSGAGENAAPSKKKAWKGASERVIVTDLRALIYCPAEVFRLSEGLEFTEDGGVRGGGAEGAYWILMK